MAVSAIFAGVRVNVDFDLNLPRSVISDLRPDPGDATIDNQRRRLRCRIQTANEQPVASA